ncbi:MAG: mechanosensitive ion channel [Gammaproteobacteria bacterium]|jgi:small-conductance mechanosensitive channel|nr:mechanosensitive ion channel [Gammaproteobacteria bacterium]
MSAATLRRVLSTACLLLLVLPLWLNGQTTFPERWFEIETLNAGLGEPPADLDRSTPRQAVSQLLLLADEGDYARAAHLLNLNELPEDEQTRRGPELARKLVEIINRTMVVDWAALPSRSDALLETSSGERPLAGQARRSIEMSFLELDPAPAEIRINRLKPAESDAVWVFARQTVDDIDALYERYGPGWLEERLPDVLQRPAFSGTRIWEWLALPVTIGVLVLLGWVTHSLLGGLGRAVPVDWINRAAGRMRMPLAVALMAMLGQFLTGWVISFSGFFYTVLSPLLIGLTIVGLTLAVLRTIDATLEKVTERFVDDIDDSSERDRRKLYTSIYALRRFVLLAAVLISAVLFMVQLRLFDNVGMSLLASAGVITVVLGIAGRTVLGNILASLQIAIAKPVRIGDAVQYEEHWGYVESIYYSFLVLRTWDGRRLVVPVQYFITYPFENWSMVDASITRTFALRLDHCADPGRLREVFEAVAREDGKAIEDELLMTAVTEHNEDYQEITFFATAANPTEAWLMKMRLREKMADWIREHHPDWWPSDRVQLDRLPAGDGESTGRSSGRGDREGD